MGLEEVRDPKSNRVEHRLRRQEGHVHPKDLPELGLQPLRFGFLTKAAGKQAMETCKLRDIAEGCLTDTLRTWSSQSPRGGAVQGGTRYQDSAHD